MEPQWNRKNCIAPIRDVRIWNLSGIERTEGTTAWDAKYKYKVV